MQKNPHNSPRGGARPNSGRKPLPPTEKKIALTVRVSRETVEAVRREAVCRGVSQAKLIEALFADPSIQRIGHVVSKPVAPRVDGKAKA